MRPAKAGDAIEVLLRGEWRRATVESVITDAANGAPIIIATIGSVRGYIVPESHWRWPDAEVTT